MVLLLFQHTYLPISMWKPSLSGSAVSWMASSSSQSLGCILSLGSTRGGSAGILTCQSTSVLLYLVKSTSRCLGVECSHQPLDISGKLCVSSSSFSYIASIKVPGRMCHRSVKTSYFGSTFLEGGSLVSHSSQHVGRHSLPMSHCKGPHHGCLSRLCAQWSASTAFNLWAAHRCVLHRQGFSSSVLQAVVGATQVSTTNIYQQCWKKWARWCAQDCLSNNAISAHKLTDFLKNECRLLILFNLH